MLKFAETIAAPLTAIAVGTMGGFAMAGLAARAIDSYEARKCPGVTRIRVNDKTLLRDWAAWGACPREGLVAPLKP
jgi:hypothetical protein